MTNLVIYKFMSLDERDMNLVAVLLRLLVAKSCLNLKDRWADVQVSCFLPLAFKPQDSVVGAQLLLKPKEMYFRNYSVTQRENGTDLSISTKQSPVAVGDPTFQAIVQRINPFIMLQVTPDGVCAFFTEVAMPDGSTFVTGAEGRDIDDDIMTVAGGIVHSPLDVTP
jgi:hypothetical protein